MMFCPDKDSSFGKKKLKLSTKKAAHACYLTFLLSLRLLNGNACRLDSIDRHANFGSCIL